MQARREGTATTGTDTARWPIGCQARPWMLALGEAFPRRLPEVMAAIAALGFTGFETRLNHLPLDDPDSFAAASEHAGGLALCGAHLGGKWWSPEGEASIPGIVAQARKLPALGCRRLVVSMAALPPDATDAQLDRMVSTLARLGAECHAAAGVALALHNHAAELADDARILHALMDGTPPEAVSLAADLGWVAHTGADVPAFLRRFGPRVGYLHLRDLHAVPGGAWTEVGRGVLDYRAILAALDAIGYTGWLVAESEFDGNAPETVEPRETAATQYRGIRAAVHGTGA